MMPVFLLPFLPYILAGIMLVGGVFGIRIHDEHVRDEGDKAGYARAVSENVSAKKAAEHAYAERAKKLLADVEAQRTLDAKDLHDAEANGDALESALANGKGKDCIAWSKATAAALQR